MFFRFFVSSLLVILALSCAHLARKEESAKMLIAKGAYEEALQELSQVESQNPDSSEVHYLLATAYLIGPDRLDEAREHVLRAIKLAQKPYPEAENLAGAIFLELGMPGEAREHLMRALENPQYKTPYLAEQNLGRAFAELGNPQESALHYANALSAQPSLCEAYPPYVEQLALLSQFRDAEENLLQYLKRCDSNDSQAQESMKEIRAHLQK